LRLSTLSESTDTLLEGKVAMGSARTFQIVLGDPEWI
jgi:hypothetical protein